MKKIHFPLLPALAACCFMLILSLPAWAANGKLTGKGSETTPYQIEDYADLKAFAKKVNSGKEVGAWAVLTNDITVTDTSWVPIGNEYSVMYTGTFDGQWHTITNLNNGEYNEMYVGLFGRISGGSVKNVGLVNSKINNDNPYVGGITGYLTGGTVENCFNIGGSVTGTASNVGGIAGVSNNGIIRNCFNTASLSGGHLIGGIVGKSFENSKVQNCYNTGSVTGDDDVGGIVGYCLKSTVTNCFFLDSIPLNALGYEVHATAINVSSLNIEGFKDKNSFSQWENFDENWYMGEDAPLLKPFCYRVTLHSNYGTDTVYNYGVLKRQKSSLPSYPFARDGFLFVKWTTNADGSGNSYYDGASIKPTGDIDLYAQWGECRRCAYVDCDGRNMLERDCIAVTSEVKTLDNNWYAVSGSGTISGRLTVKGNVNLILCDGAELTVTGGIYVGSDNSLTIWAQSLGDSAGRLSAVSNDKNCAGIGGASDIGVRCGKVVINGGIISAEGGSNAAGIGDGYSTLGSQNCTGTFVINGGRLTVYGGNAIGGNYRSDSYGKLSLGNVRARLETGDWVSADERETICRTRKNTIIIERCAHPVYDESGRCRHCSAHIIKGDVDSDGAVTPLDAMILARYLAGWSGYTVNSYAADMDKDRNVTVRDAIILARRLAG